MLTYTESLAEGKAQTIVQLLNQLQRQGARHEHLLAVRRAYETALSICSSVHRSSGRLLIDHCIGAASILAGLAAGEDFVLAGVVHAAYLHGDFGGWRKRIDAAKRARIREAAGGAAEQLVYRYSYGGPNPGDPDEMRRRAASADVSERHLVLIRLADLLDIYGEPDALYCHNAAKRRAFAAGPGAEIAVIATDLGYPALADALARAFARARDTALPEALTTPAWRDETVYPPSFRVPLALAAYRRARASVYALTGR